MTDQERLIEDVKEKISEEKKILNELVRFNNQLRTSDDEEKNLVAQQIDSLKNHLRNVNADAMQTTKGIYLAKPLNKEPASPQEEVKKPVQEVPQQAPPAEVKKPVVKRKIFSKLSKDLKPVGLERETIKRFKKAEKKVKEEKEKKPSSYAKLANKFFSGMTSKLKDKKMFQTLERDLIKGNIQFTQPTYISIILFTTLLSFFASLLIFLFFMFFNFGAELPIITKSTEDFGSRFLKVFWVVIFLPALTFFLAYVYPSMEKGSTETKIDYELPFATINMAAISGSLIDPSKIFRIIISTNEYPALSKEFTKIINEINIQGYNFVSALRNASFNSPSKKLSELFSGLATTINSGGDLPEFFDERSKSLLFEHRLEREKQSKAAETFMDIYISVVVAAPMILMLLLMMMKISGLGISVSTGTITLIIVLGVSVINIVFLTFLHLRKTE